MVTAVSDHHELSKICAYILTKGGRSCIRSLQIDQINKTIAGFLKVDDIETVVLAPEPGSQWLRHFSRKVITEEDILYSAELLIENEIASLRLYFMIGLPDETPEDIDVIIDFTKKIQHHVLKFSTGKKNSVV